MSADLISVFEAAMERRLRAMPGRIRPFTRDYSALPRALMLTGSRGVGKTTFLLYHACQKTGESRRPMLYFSADHPRLAAESLYEFVGSVFMAGYAGVVIDEVHHVRDWGLHLKALYDDYPEHFLWVSDSSSLVLRSGQGDTARRFVPIRMPIMSFREFLYLESGDQCPVSDPFAQRERLPVEPSPAVLQAFRRYKAVGTRPFYGQGNFEERMLAVLEKTLHGDVPFFLPGVTDGNLRLMSAIVGHLASSTIPRLQVRSLCADWGIGAEKLYAIVDVMEAVGLLRIIRIQNDTKTKSVGHKMFFADPCLYSVLHGSMGNLRESLCAAFCAEAGWLVEASKDETRGDLVVTRGMGSEQQQYRLEIGGASKDAKQADFVIRDDMDYPAGRAVPLWLLGMGW